MAFVHHSFNIKTNHPLRSLENNNYIKNVFESIENSISPANIIIIIFTFFTRS